MLRILRDQLEAFLFLFKGEFESTLTPLAPVLDNRFLAMRFVYKSKVMLNFLFDSMEILLKELDSSALLKESLDAGLQLLVSTYAHIYLPVKALLKKMRVFFI